MYIGIKAVKPLSDYKLLLTFKNDEVREFDMSGYLNRGIFKQLQDQQLFRRVRVNFDFLEWPNGADFDPEGLYEESQSVVVKVN